MERRELLWPGGFRLIYDEGCFPPSTDSFLLAAFPRLKRNTAVCDLGAGTGLLGLLLLGREPSLTVTGVELQESACRLLRQTAEENGLTERLLCCPGDLRDKALLPPGGFGLVVSNPPYFPPESGALPPETSRRLARSEGSCSPEELCAAASRLLRWGGSFCLVHRPERLAELMEALRRHRLEPKRLRFVQHHAAAAPSLLLLDSRLGGHPGLTVEPPLLLTGPDGRETEEVRRIYFKDKPENFKDKDKE